MHRIQANQLAGGACGVLGRVMLWSGYKIATGPGGAPADPVTASGGAEKSTS